MNPRPRVSIAIPLLNEEAVLPALLQRVTGMLDTLPGGPHEVVFVDDGSTDRTFELLSAAAQADSRMTVIQLSRNFGHQAALCAALKHVAGDVVVLMDGDLQDSPEAVPQMIEAYQQGHDVVYAVRFARKENILLRSCYRAFYRLISLLADTRLPLDSGDFCLMSRRVIEQLNAIPERQRYLRGLRSWVGFKQIGIPVEREQRNSGRSKYSVRRLMRLAFDGIFSFSVLPLRLATLLGMATIVLSIAWASFTIWAKLFLDRSPQGFTGLAVSIAFFAGVQLLFLGVIGEYVGRIYEEVKGRPHYIVQQLSRRARPWTLNMPVVTESFTNSIGGGALESR